MHNRFHRQVIWLVIWRFLASVVIINLIDLSIVISFVALLPGVARKSDCYHRYSYVYTMLEIFLYKLAFFLK